MFRNSKEFLEYLRIFPSFLISRSRVRNFLLLCGVALQRFSCCFAVLKPILCEGALRHRNTRDLDSDNLRAIGPNHAQLKTKQNRKQDNETRHRDQNKVNK